MNANDQLKAKRVIAEIVRLTKGGWILPKVRLIKAFYLAHACYAKRHADCLSSWPIDGAPTAEDIQRFHSILQELMKEGVIGETNSIIYPSSHAQRIAPLTDPERASIVAAINLVGLRSFSFRPQRTHAVP